MSNLTFGTKPPRLPGLSPGAKARARQQRKQQLAVVSPELPLEAETIAPEPNPCVRLYGPGPAGATCKTCALLRVRSFDKNYYKCSLRKMTCGPGTDHRVGWKACAKYEKEGA